MTRPVALNFPWAAIFSFKIKDADGVGCFAAKLNDRFILGRTILQGGNMRTRGAIGIALGLVLSLVVVSLAFGADAKIGVINLEKILKESEAGKSAENEIVGEVQRMENDLKRKSDDINALQKQLESDGGVMSKEAREEKKWDLDKKINEAKSLQKKYGGQIQELRTKNLNQIRQGLLPIIQEYGQKENYTVIIDNMGVIYAQQGSDITDKIIKLYNDQHGRGGKKK
jgi:outer membrane protein